MYQIKIIFSPVNLPGYSSHSVFNSEADLIEFLNTNPVIIKFGKIISSPETPEDLVIAKQKILDEIFASNKIKINTGLKRDNLRLKQINIMERRNSKKNIETIHQRF